MQVVKSFLLENGFVKIADNKFKNKKCEVVINENHYQVKFDRSKRTGHMYSNDLNIYWLIGVLTYNNIIDRNYKNIRPTKSPNMIREDGKVN